MPHGVLDEGQQRHRRAAQMSNVGIRVQLVRRRSGMRMRINSR